MTKIFADITVEDDQGEITKYRAAVLGLERIEFVLGQRSEFLLVSLPQRMSVSMLRSTNYRLIIWI